MAVKLLHIFTDPLTGHCHTRQRRICGLSGTVRSFFVGGQLVTNLTGLCGSIPRIPIMGHELVTSDSLRDLDTRHKIFGV
jgi:hypothetical protein